MKNRLAKSIMKVGIPLAGLGLASVPAYAQMIDLGEGYSAETQKAYNDLATADDVVHEVHVNKYINSSSGTTSVTYFALPADRSKMLNWKEQLIGLAKIATEKSHNKVLTEKEAGDILWDAYVFEYKRQNESQGSK
jgi:hypothetical protein